MLFRSGLLIAVMLMAGCGQDRGVGLRWLVDARGPVRTAACSARGVRESEKKKERKSECGGREKRSPLPLIYWRSEGIVGAGSPAHDVRNGRGVSAHDLPRGFRRRLPGRTICRIRGHRNPRARSAPPEFSPSNLQLQISVLVFLCFWQIGRAHV